MNTITGFIADDIVNLQQTYYIDIQSRKTGSSWATNLIIQLWNFIQQIWFHRNNILHNGLQAQLLSGLPTLKTSISNEYTVGLGTLPHLYSSYFHPTLPTILSRSPTQLIKWFQVIRSARESYQHNLTQDDFSLDGPLRRWVGLSAIS